MEDLTCRNSKRMAVDGLFYGLGILLAFLLKQHYSHAGSDDLLWILSPVAGLVQWMGNIGFTYEPHTGFINPDYRVVIAPACAGINLLIVSFTMAVFVGIRHMGDIRRKMMWCCFSAVAAYALVIGANALRIYLSVVFYAADLKAGWLTPARCHRLLGIVIYFFFHYQFYLIMKKVSERFGGKREGMNGRTSLGSLAPLGWYLGITLVVPLLNAAYRNNRGPFVEHGLFVITAATMMWLFFRTTSFIMKRFRSRRI